MTGSNKMGEFAILKSKLLPYYDMENANIVFVNGWLAPELSKIAELPQETKTSKDGVSMRIKKGTVFPKTIHLLHVTQSNGDIPQTTSRNRITVEESGEATLLESYLTLDNDLSYTMDTENEILLEENAVLHYCKAQGEGKKSTHKSTTHVKQKRNSSFAGFVLTTGSDNARDDLKVTLNGEGASATLNGLYLTDDRQKITNHTFVEHLAANTTSNQLYKGVLNGASRAVFQGRIFVCPQAQQTNAYQLNKNLLLGKDCRVDTSPQLEIFADDVKCNHGATIGQLNEDELFYLQTRCISKKEATKILVRGFVDDVMDTIGNDSIAKRLQILLEPTFSALER